MRRADRLFDIIQQLRRKRLMRARDLAEDLEVSERTIYRDIRDLMASGVPIEGEAGVGYMLRDGYDLPPLMFNLEELEALILGARIVETWSDQGLADAAANAITKVEAVLPRELGEFMAGTSLFAPPWSYVEPTEVDLAQIRRALRDRLKIKLAYRDAEASVSDRVIRPLALSYFGPVWLLSGWCEMRAAFRTFRADRIVSAEVLDERFAQEPGKTVRDFLVYNENSRRDYLASE